MILEYYELCCRSEVHDATHTEIFEQLRKHAPEVAPQEILAQKLPADHFRDAPTEAHQAREVVNMNFVYRGDGAHGATGAANKEVAVDGTVTPCEKHRAAKCLDKTLNARTTCAGAESRSDGSDTERSSLEAGSSAHTDRTRSEQCLSSVEVPAPILCSESNDNGSAVHAAYMPWESSSEFVGEITSKTCEPERQTLRTKVTAKKSTQAATVTPTDEDLMRSVLDMRPYHLSDRSAGVWTAVSTRLSQTTQTLPGGEDICENSIRARVDWLIGLANDSDHAHHTQLSPTLLAMLNEYTRVNDTKLEQLLVNLHEPQSVTKSSEISLVNESLDDILLREILCVRFKTGQNKLAWQRVAKAVNERVGATVFVQGRSCKRRAQELLSIFRDTKQATMLSSNVRDKLSQLEEIIQSRHPDPPADASDENMALPDIIPNLDNYCDDEQTTELQNVIENEVVEQPVSSQDGPTAMSDDVEAVPEPTQHSRRVVPDQDEEILEHLLDLRPFWAHTRRKAPMWDLIASLITSTPIAMASDLKARVEWHVEVAENPGHDQHMCLGPSLSSLLNEYLSPSDAEQFGAYTRSRHYVRKHKKLKSKATFDDIVLHEALELSADQADDLWTSVAERLNTRFKAEVFRSGESCKKRVEMLLEAYHSKDPHLAINITPQQHKLLQQIDGVWATIGRNSASAVKKRRSSPTSQPTVGRMKRKASSPPPREQTLSSPSNDNGRDGRPSKRRSRTCKDVERDAGLTGGGDAQCHEVEDTMDAISTPAVNDADRGSRSKRQRLMKENGHHGDAFEESELIRNEIIFRVVLQHQPLPADRGLKRDAWDKVAAEVNKQLRKRRLGTFMNGAKVLTHVEQVLEQLKTEPTAFPERLRNLAEDYMEALPVRSIDGRERQPVGARTRREGRRPSMVSNPEIFRTQECTIRHSATETSAQHEHGPLDDDIDHEAEVAAVCETVARLSDKVSAAVVATGSQTPQDQRQRDAPMVECNMREALTVVPQLLQLLESQQRVSQAQHQALVELLRDEREANQRETKADREAQRRETNALEAISRERQDRRDEFAALTNLILQTYRQQQLNQ